MINLNLFLDYVICTQIQTGSHIVLRKGSLSYIINYVELKCIFNEKIVQIKWASM